MSEIYRRMFSVGSNNENNNTTFTARKTSEAQHTVTIQRYNRVAQKSTPKRCTSKDLMWKYSSEKTRLQKFTDGRQIQMFFLTMRSFFLILGAATNKTQHPAPACVPSFYSSIYVHYRLRQLAFPQYEISTQPPVVAVMFINHAPVQPPSTPTASVGVMHRQSQRPTGHNWLPVLEWCSGSHSDRPATTLRRLFPPLNAAAQTSKPKHIHYGRPWVTKCLFATTR